MVVVLDAGFWRVFWIPGESFSTGESFSQNNMLHRHDPWLIARGDLALLESAFCIYKYVSKHPVRDWATPKLVIWEIF